MANADFNAPKLNKEAKKFKKLKLSSCWHMSVKPRPKCPAASTSNDGIIRYPACEEEYCDPPIQGYSNFFSAGPHTYVSHIVWSATKG
ncbi:hypothetical protein TNCV_821231 [Trichonephila clavipes]|nr:hypothetical protein TNCV_821231 [Trichonephila clavipes]